MSGMVLFEDQKNVLNLVRQAFKEGHRSVMLYGPTGFGKCLGKDTPVLMADGSTKLVQNVLVGDQLLGPDGGVRNVLSLAAGQEMLYYVSQERGRDYIVNESHILSLRNERLGIVKNIPVAEYLNEPQHWRMRNHGWSAPGILHGDKSYKLSRISVKPIGIGDYFGFEIDGDHLFLLGDFTVTHNTECAISMLSATAEKQNTAAMILDRIVLCNQTSARLDKYRIDHGVLQAGHWRHRPYEKIQVCSAQTLEKRGSLPGMKLLIVDEAHAQRKQTTTFIKNNKDVRVVGLSASPFAEGLGNTYTKVVSATTTAKLVEAKRLAPMRVFIAKEVDMNGAKKVAGEWSTDEAASRSMQITGDVVAEWVKKTTEIFGGPRKTIVFCSNVAHGADLAQRFSEAGYNFVPISYKDDSTFKEDAVKEFSKPDSTIHGLISVDILSKGFDVSDVMIGVSARPFSKSFMSHVQQMGRVMRSHPGKDFCVWLDHSGNYLRFQEDWDELYHDGVHELKDGKEKTRPEPTDKEKEQAKCPKCGALWVGKSDNCVVCGYHRPFVNLVDEVPGEMVALAAAQKREEKQDFYSQLLGIAHKSGYSDGWAGNKFKEKYGAYPRGLNEVAAPVTLKVANWVKSRQIAWAKSKYNRSA